MDIKVYNLLVESDLEKFTDDFKSLMPTSIKKAQTIPQFVFLFALMREHGAFINDDYAQTCVVHVDISKLPEPKFIQTGVENFDKDALNKFMSVAGIGKGKLASIVDVSRPTVQNWCNGVYSPKTAELKKLQKVAREFGVPVTFLKD